MTARQGGVTFALVPIARIDAPELPSRAGMDERLLDELADSIRAIGLMTPIAVARVDDRYEVIAGHRRLCASLRVGLGVVPCMVYPEKGAALEAIKFAENHFREDLNAGDEAIWFTELLERHCGGDTNRLADFIHKSRNYVESRLLLFSGDPMVFDALRDGRIGIGVAGELNKCSEELMRRYFLATAIRGGATVGVVAGWVNQWRATLGALGEPAAVPAPASEVGAVPTTNYFTCYVCGGTEDVHLMQPVNVHAHCKKAILDKLVHGEQGVPT